MEWMRVTWGESGVYGFGKRTEGTTTRIPVQSQSPILQILSFLGETLPSMWHQPGGKQ